MALTFPYPLAFFSDILRANKVQLRLRRFDETSGTGDGRMWSATLAPPLWSAQISLASRGADMAREVEAKADGLDGQRGTFLFADPTYPGPTNGVSGLGGVTVSAIASDRSRITLTGLPAGFTLAAGDRLSIAHSSGRVWFGSFAEPAVANGSGVTPSREIRPHLALGVNVGASVELVKPYFKAIIPTGGFSGFDYDMPNGEIALGGSMQVLQKP